MIIPLTVPKESQNIYELHMNVITKNTKNALLFVYDHRLEHLQYDFYTEGVAQNAYSVEHAFSIAAHSNIGAFVTHLGLISRYANMFKNIPYIVKLTGKVPVRTFTDDAYNYPLCTVEDIVNFKNDTNLCIPGVAVVVYLGSIYEKEMIQFASQTILEAHKYGLATFLFMYLKGLPNVDDPMLIAGAAGVANVLGADFVKLHGPKNREELNIIKRAAGNTNIVYAGGERVENNQLISRIQYEVENGYSNGVVIGRNIFQRPENEAIALINQIADIVYF